MQLHNQKQCGCEAPDIFVVVLNWNGAADTLECIKSLIKSTESNFRIVVVDNGSTDASLERIEGSIAGYTRTESGSCLASVSEAHAELTVYDRQLAERGGDREMEVRLSKLSVEQSIVAIAIGENIGFAAGANVGIRYALARHAKYVWLLNNDTVVERTTMQRLRAAMVTSGAAIATAQIRYFDRPHRIWNCGGNITLIGTRKYLFANCHVGQVPTHGIRKITFVTGCAAFLRVEVLRSYGLLTERFFFGEEDADLSLRMKRANQQLICVYDAIVYHKVGRSLDTTRMEVLVGKIYINYLNRFINMRQYWPKMLWNIWRIVYCAYILPMMWKRHGVSILSGQLVIRELLKDSKRLESVDRDTFTFALSGARFSSVAREL